MPFTVTPDGHAQADGRRYVTEVHSDGVGEFARLEYLAAVGADTNAIATARNAVLLVSAADNEAEQAYRPRDLGGSVVPWHQRIPPEPIH